MQALGLVLAHGCALVAAPQGLGVFREQIKQKFDKTVNDRQDDDDDEDSNDDFFGDSNSDDLFKKTAMEQADFLVSMK